MRVIDPQEPPERNEKRSDGDEGRGELPPEGVKQIIRVIVLHLLVWLDGWLAAIVQTIKRNARTQAVPGTVATSISPRP